MSIVEKSGFQLQFCARRHIGPQKINSRTVQIGVGSDFLAAPLGLRLFARRAPFLLFGPAAPTPPVGRGYEFSQFSSPPWRPDTSCKTKPSAHGWRSRAAVDYS